VIAPITNNPPTTPPTMAPTLGPELDLVVDELIVEGTAEAATHTVCWHASQDGGTREQISPLGQVGHDGEPLPHWTHPRRKRDSKETVSQLAGLNTAHLR
jgi:hypothetical protein